MRRLAPIAAALVLLASALRAAAADVLVAQGATWKYKDDGSNQGTAWSASAFDDTLWASGPAQLGYGDGDEATVVSYGPNASAKYVTTYFRRTFAVASPADYTSLSLRLLRDDGAVVYLNGTEVRRDNMPSGAVSYTTLASVALGAPDESTFFTTSLSTSAGAPTPRRTAASATGPTRRASTFSPTTPSRRPSTRSRSRVSPPRRNTSTRSARRRRRSGPARISSSPPPPRPQRRRASG